MSLHHLASITIGVPEPEPVRAFYRDLGLGETQPGRLTTCDGGEQLRIETAKQRRLVALTVASTTISAARPRASASSASPSRRTGARSLRSSPRLPAPLVFLHHSAWEMDDLDAVGRAGAAMVGADASRHVWGLGRHAIGSNYFWYLRDPAGNFAEYTSDLDVIADAEAWKVASSAPVHGLAAWGPPVPKTFLAPDDIMALAAGRA